MARFIMVCLGGDKPARPEEGKKHFADYMQWISSLRAAASAL